MRDGLQGRADRIFLVTCSHQQGKEVRTNAGGWTEDQQTGQTPEIQNIELKHVLEFEFCII